VTNVYPMNHRPAKQWGLRVFFCGSGHIYCICPPRRVIRRDRPGI